MAALGDPVVQVLAGLLFVVVAIAGGMFWKGWQKKTFDYRTGLYDRIQAEQARWRQHVRNENCHGRIVLPTIENGLYYDPDGSVIPWPTAMSTRQKK